MRAEEAAEASPKRPRGRDRRVRVARTPLGRGVFAQRNYLAGEIVGEISGTVIDDPDYGSNYCMDLGDGRSLEPDAPFRFMNHSCQPNCRLHPYDVRANAHASLTRRMFVIAETDIRCGAELTIDYAWPAKDAMPCRCHSSDCRGWIVAEEELSLVPSVTPQARAAG